MREKHLKIALLGTRGVPASYSGFETCVEQLGARLVERGHAVTVYRRSHHYNDGLREYRGMRLVTLPTIANKYLDTIVHTTISATHALTQRYDVALFFIAGNSPVAWIPRVAGQRVAINVDGLDWRRQKWPRWARRLIRLLEQLSKLTANEVVTDSRVVATFYQEEYGFQPHYIPYGSSVDPCPPGDVLERLGLDAGRYVIFVGRLVPENCVHHLVDAFKSLETDMKCVIVGDAPYAEAYQKTLKANSDPRIVFTGYLFGEGYAELCTNSYVFVETAEVGGTHPALVEAMAFGTAVVVNGTAENKETIADAGLSYDGHAGGDSLRVILRKLMDNPSLRDEFAMRARARAESAYSWEKVTDAYESLFYTMTRNGS